MNFWTRNCCVMTYNHIFIVSWTRLNPCTICSSYKFFIYSTNTVRKLFKGTWNWGIIICWSWISSFFEWSRCNSISIQFRIDSWFTSCCKSRTLNSFRCYIIATGAWSWFWIIFESLFFTTWPTWPFIIFTCIIWHCRIVIIRSRHVT